MSNAKMPQAPQTMDTFFLNPTDFNEMSNAGDWEETLEIAYEITNYHPLPAGENIHSGYSFQSEDCIAVIGAIHCHICLYKPSEKVKKGNCVAEADYYYSFLKQYRENVK